MALTSTIFTFDIELADVDRGVYETLSLRVPCHPSETEERLVARVLAYCLEYTEGIAFSNGLSDPDLPTISIRDLTGTLLAWIDVGAPDAARVHRASKAAGRVAVYAYEDPARLLRAWSGERIHRSEEIELHVIDRAMLASIVAQLKRRMQLALMITGGQLYVTVESEVIEGAVRRQSITPP